MNRNMREVFFKEIMLKVQDLMLTKNYEGIVSPELWSGYLEMQVKLIKREKLELTLQTHHGWVFRINISDDRLSGVIRVEVKAFEEIYTRLIEHDIRKIEEVLLL